MYRSACSATRPRSWRHCARASRWAIKTVSGYE